MKRLILMRHAKSAWDDPTAPDHDRPLNQRGRLAATLMGAWLAELTHRPSRAVISSSRRTQDTWERIAAVWPEAPPAQISARLYMAEPEALLAETRMADDRHDVVLLLAHNPGLEAFAARLCGAGGPKPGRFPTASVGVLALTHAEDAPWSSADWGRFVLETFEQPKSLV